MKLLLTALTLVFSLPIVTSASADVFGRARIIDGDSLVIHEERIRLHGIDAPERRQTCLEEKKEWACGVESTDALERMIDEREIHCVGDKRDRYKRLIAVCYVGALNLNKQMVSEGWALAYRHHSKDYIPEENAANAAKLGMWRGEFIAPWDWRKKQRSKKK